MLKMAKLYRKLASVHLTYFIVTAFSLFLEHQCEHSSPHVRRISESLSKSVCHYTGMFASTKQIQPGLDDPKKFPQFATSKILQWIMNAYPDCNTFERLPKEPPSNTTEPKLIKKQHGGLSKGLNGSKIRNRNTRIIGGKDAEVNEFPYQALLTAHFKDGIPFICGASIYNSMFLLTAAHCLVRDEDLVNYTVTVGDHSTKEVDSTEQVLLAEKIIPHENYVHEKTKNDVAVIKLAKPMQFTKGVEPVLMPKPNQKPCGQVIATGWGRLGPAEEHPDILQKVTIPIVPLETCRKAHAEIGNVYDTNTCAGLTGQGGKDTCQGDSGGPLAKKLSNGSYVLIGITSWGQACGTPKAPGVYTDVAQYVDWIHSKVTKLS